VCLFIRTFYNEIVRVVYKNKGKTIKAIKGIKKCKNMHLSSG